MADKRKTRRGGFYWVDKTPYISVTEVLKVIDKSNALMYWFGREIYYAMVKDPTLDEKSAMSAPYKVSERAKSRGTTVHSIVEAYKTTGKQIETVPDKYKGYAEAFYRWVDDFNPRFVENEKTILSHKHRYAGTLDAIIEINGEKVLLDVKTSKKGEVYKEAHLQVSAYILALKEMGESIDRGFVLALSDTGKYNYAEIEYSPEAFLHAKALYEFLNGEKCRRAGYSAKSVQKSS